ncbi:hypothetical protein Bca101_064464 [Brassica carinata]
MLDNEQDLHQCLTMNSISTIESFNEMVNPNGATDTNAKEPGQWGGGYVGWCRHGCCYTGRNGCIQCCRYANEQINSVGMQKRGRGQVEEKSSKEEKASPVWTQGRP